MTDRSRPPYDTGNQMAGREHTFDVGCTDTDPLSRARHFEFHYRRDVPPYPNLGADCGIDRPCSDISARMPSW